MHPEVDRFHKWLLRKRPRSATVRHYTHDVQLFFRWLDKAPKDVTVLDVDAFIEHCQGRGHRIATVNRRLAAVRGLYRFLALDEPTLPNPVVVERHFIPHGQRLPRDARDSDVQKLFDVVDDVRDRAIFLLMLRCGLRVGEICALTLTDIYLEPT
ncbi:MAG: site-specific integrase, partial [Anaerolineales bacterium]|nr:site-specific integrase [Anaerolineales bacterium]